MSKFDLVIAVARSDCYKLSHCVPAAREYISGIGDIHIITPEPNMVPDLSPGFPIHVHKDEWVLGIDRGTIPHRPNWIYQIFIKLFQQVTSTDYWLCMDSDFIPVKGISPFLRTRPTFMLDRTKQYHQPYFNFSQRMLGIGKVAKHSFISEIALYKRQYIDGMIQHADCNTAQEFMLSAIDKIEPDVCYPAESELYGSYVTSHHPTAYRTQKLRVKMGGRYNGQPYTEAEIDGLVLNSTKADFDAVTIHDWRWDKE